jgi:hypothetical protein
VGREYLTGDIVHPAEVFYEDTEVKLAPFSTDLGSAEMLNVMTHGAESNETIEFLDKLTIVIFPDFVAMEFRFGTTNLTHMFRIGVRLLANLVPF